MLTEATRVRAERMAEDLRRRGEEEPAHVIETLVREAQGNASAPLDLLTSTQAGELLGVTGQTIKNWVREGNLDGYRIGGRILVPRRVVEEYVARAGISLELEEFSDEEAARLVAEGRRHA
jgi:excisionase family DNA binding protein